MKDNPLARWWRLYHQAESASNANSASATTTPTSGPEPEPIKVELINPEDFVGADSAKNERLVREGFSEKAKRYLRYLPMAEEVVAAHFCMLDSKTPLWVKGTVAAALAYFILPIDAIPDILPIVGMSDDAAVVTAALTAISGYITEAHHQKARDWLRIEQVVTTAKNKAQAVP